MQSDIAIQSVGEVVHIMGELCLEELSSCIGGATKTSVVVLTKQIMQVCGCIMH